MFLFTGKPSSGS